MKFVQYIQSVGAVFTVSFPSGPHPSVAVHFDFNYMDADWPSYGFDDLCSDLTLING